MYTLAIPPDQGSYAIDASDDFVETKLDGGTSRRRADLDGATRQITVQWSTDGNEYSYLQAFYRLTGKLGAPFLCGLVNDSSVLTNYTCWFTAGSFKLSSVTGDTWISTAILEVVPAPVDNDADTSFVTLFSAFPDDEILSAILAQTANIVNNILPTV
jgi:hypothetical protein